MSQTASVAAPKRIDDVVTRVVAGETVLVPVRARVGDLDHVYVLDEVGTFIWGLIDGEREPSAIRAAILEEFEVDEATADRDLTEFLGDLAEAGLISAGGER